jgi:glycosyltransferase involved in cell wall biosynthesis
MKILICSTLEKRGGAAKSAQRVSECLKQEGLNVKNFHFFKDSQEKKSPIPKIDAIPKLLCSKKRKTPFSSSFFSFGSRKFVEKYNPHILHLNYINMGMFSIKDIGRFKMPIVWTLHDSWTFTGGCHLPGDCTKYTSRCQKCPALGSKRNFDLSTYVFSLKEKHWDFNNMVLVCPSRWMAENARRSKLFKNSRIEVIPNPIDTKIFKPKDRKKSREKFKLNEGKKYILFGSVNPLTDKNKGFEYLMGAINCLNLKNTELIVFGTDDEEIDINIPVKSVGYIMKEEEMAYLYSACDLTVMPSLSENLPNNLIESVACGTPCVAFHVGGIPEIIDRAEFGETAKELNPKSLSQSIQKTLSRDIKYERKTWNKVVENKYGYRTIAKKYRELYESLTSNI